MIDGGSLEIRQQTIQTEHGQTRLADGSVLAFHAESGQYFYNGPDRLLSAFFAQKNSPVTQTQKKLLYLSLKNHHPLPPIRIVLSGSFCTGKTTIGKVLADELGIAKLIDDSTRAMRPGERAGFPYNFVSAATFKERKQSGYYFEAIDFGGASYGVPHDKVKEARWSIDLKPSSFAYYKDHLTSVLGVYLEAPAAEELRRRARFRGDSEASIERRLALAAEDSAEGFDVMLGPDLSMEEKVERIKAAIFAFIVHHVAPESGH